MLVLDDPAVIERMTPDMRVLGAVKARGIAVTAWCLGETNAAFMRRLGIDAAACDVPVGDVFTPAMFAKLKDALALGRWRWDTDAQ